MNTLSEHSPIQSDFHDLIHNVEFVTFELWLKSVLKVSHDSAYVGTWIPTPDLLGFHHFLQTKPPTLGEFEGLRSE